MAYLMDLGVPICVYCNGSGFEGGIGASAILCIQDKEVNVLQCYLGTNKQHTDYEGEGVVVASEAIEAHSVMAHHLHFGNH